MPQNKIQTVLDVLFLVFFFSSFSEPEAEADEPELEPESELSSLPEDDSSSDELSFFFLDFSFSTFFSF